MRFDDATLLRVENELVRGEVRPESIRVLLEAVRHLQRCASRRGATRRSSERRRAKTVSGPGRKKGHGRIGADAYTGAEREEILHLSDPEGAVLTPSATTHTVTKVEDDLVCIVGSKAVGGDHTPDGGSVVYAIALTNTGSAGQRDLVGNEFTDTISNDLTLLSASATSGTASTSANTATWNGSIPAGGSVTITLNAQTNLGTAGYTLSNFGTFAYDLHHQGTNTATGQTNTVSSQVAIGRAAFYAVTPCRVLDTRTAAGPYGGPALSAGVPREFTIHGTCGIPDTAKAISLNLTAVSPTAPGQVTLYPAGIPPTGTTTINYSTGQVRANNSVMMLNAGKLAAVCGQQAGTSVHIIVDVNGYFQ